MKNKLKDIIKDFPVSPGVYQFIDKGGDILYVGKAKNLKSRIKSYFLKEIGRGPVIDIMVGMAIDVKYAITDSEIEAVLLEAELIKKLKPKYNAKLKDDKSFLVIKITKKISKNLPYRHPRAGRGCPAGCNAMARGSKIVNLSVDSRTPSGIPDLRGNDNIEARDDSTLFPCVGLVRAKNVDFADKTAEYFGPYPAGELLKKSLQVLRKIFPYRDCSKTKFNTYRKKSRPCIYGDIRVCTAPCVDWVSMAQYQKNIGYLKDFLRGKKQEIYRKLEKEMSQLSKGKRFEEAGLVRDKLRALDHLKDVAIGLRDDVFNSGNSLFKRIECYDISNIGEKYVVGSMVVFKDGKKDTDQYRHFKIRNSQSSFQPEARELESMQTDSGSPGTTLSATSPVPRMTKRGESDLSRLKEMLERRFKNDWPMPDLIVIDGGENQLRVALEVLKEYNLIIPVISIAKGPTRKKNEFHFGDENIAKYFHKNSYIQNVAISARDEAHRFAISYYRLLHRKDMIK